MKKCLAVYVSFQVNSYEQVNILVDVLQIRKAISWPWKQEQNYVLALSMIRSSYGSIQFLF